MKILYLRNMNYQCRVTLTGIKGFFRVYSINAANSLYTFHKQLQADLEFPADQPILFKALDAGGNVLARYALIDLGYGTVDVTKISSLVKEGVTSMVYFYDIQSKKSVTITFEGESSEAVAVPTLLESKGPAPIEFENGYVAFEDLPEEHRRLPGERKSAAEGGNDDEDLDDEDDDEDDNEDKEEEDIIYVESEED